MSMFRLSGDGMANGTVSDDLLTMLKGRLEQMQTDFAGVDPRAWEPVRLCAWEGQDKDGLRHDESGAEAFPFEGAPDFRVRLADGIINDEALLYLVAAMRAQIYVIGPGNGAQRGKSLQALAEWLKTSLWGRKYIRTVLEVAQYMLADTPAVGLVKVVWREVKKLRLEELTLPAAVELFSTGFMEQYKAGNPDATDEEAAVMAGAAREEFAGMLSAPGDEDDEALAELLLGALPYLKKARARRVVKDLRKFQVAKFPRPATVFEGPDLEACRFFEDFVFDGYATSFDDLDCWFEPLWLTEAAGRQLALDEGWSEQFQDDLFGVSADHTEGGGKKGVAAIRIGSAAEEPEEHREHYQVLRAWLQLTNDDGIVGRYWLTFRPDIGAATKLRSMDYSHGKWPAVFFEREVLNKAVLAGRGIPELVCGEQGILKVLVDGIGANAVLNFTPPILDYGRKDSGQPYIEPLAAIQMRNPNGIFKFMDGPRAPTGVIDTIRWMEQNVDAAHGRPNSLVPQARTDMVRQAKVIMFLGQLAEVMAQSMMLCQEFMTPELLEKVTGKDGAAIIKDKKEIEGPFTLSVHFNPEDMDIEKLTKKATVVKDILMQMDREGIIATSEICAHVVGALFPQLEFVKSGDQAKSDEIEDEENTYVRLLAGLQDKRPTDGSIAYEMRAQWLEGHLQQNMDQVAGLPDATKLRIEERLEFLRAQAEQFGQNAQIGREGMKGKEQGEEEEKGTEGT